MPRRYRSELRDDQAAATRERLLQAAHRLLGTTRPVDLAFSDVAAAAGVSVRTMYRHFPTSDDLFLALSDRLLAAVMGPDPRPPATMAEGAAMLRRQLALMEADPALYRVFFAVPTRSRSGGSSVFETIFGERLACLSPRARTLTYALLDLAASPYAWDVLHANWGADAEDAWRAVLVAMRAVLELVERDPRAFDHPDPVLPLERR